MRRRKAEIHRKAPQSCAAPFARHLVIMVKAPVAGRSKTRLAREIGVGRALSFARAGVAVACAKLACRGRWRTWLAVSPDTAVDAPIWPRGLAVIAQGAGDLGARMQRILTCLPPGPVVIVGTDIPRLRPRHVAHAFGLLGCRDAVLGPAGDGGYWLVGLLRRPRRIAPFGNVRWSSPHALGDTLANLGAFRVALADRLDDVDDAASLKRDAPYAGRVVMPACARENIAPLA